MVGQVRAAASIVAFSNALAVSLFGLVPGNNIGYPAVVVGVIGVFYLAAGARSIFSSRAPRHHLLRQLPMIAAMLTVFALEFAGGVVLLHDPHDTAAGQLIGNLLVALLLIGIGRAWELVGDRDTGPMASIATLVGRDPR